jgi:ABC-2 type transport system ATP-binding protein
MSTLITGFLGANGAGKSTSIEMLPGTIGPTSRSGSVQGRKIDDPEQSVALRCQLAYVSEDKRLYAYMTVEQIIRFTRASKGMRTKLALLRALSAATAPITLRDIYLQTVSEN